MNTNRFKNIDYYKFCHNQYIITFNFRAQLQGTATRSKVTVMYKD